MSRHDHHPHNRQRGEAVTDIPIIFSAQMVNALLEGRKTMTRRLAWKEPRDPSTGKIADSYQRITSWQKVNPGDRLWVRETHYVFRAGNMDGSGQDIRYRADDPGCPTTWTSPIHMYRFASRLTLEVTATKMERLQEITKHDASAEGCEGLSEAYDPRHDFMDLWDKLHGNGAWAANPEVVALTFIVHKRNIDSAEKAA